jgi:hypothetical protein
VRFGTLTAFLGVLASAGVGLVSEQPAAAGEPAGTCALNVDILLVDSSCNYSATDVIHVISDPGPVFHYFVEPLCEAMDAGQGVCVRPVHCIEPPGTYRFIVLRWTDGSPPQRIGTVCFDDDESERLGVITEDAIIRRMKALDWPSAQLVVEPPNGRTLVNLPTNFYTELVDPVVMPVQILHHRVEVRATPTSYTWHFGDGSLPESGSDPGAPYARDDSLRVSHIYNEARVTVHPSVDVTYSGAYRIDGGPWRTISTTLTKTGATVSLAVLTATPHLVG